MHDDLKQLDFALVDDAFDRIFRADSDTRQQNKQCTPVSWVGERQWEDASHDCA